MLRKIEIFMKKVMGASLFWRGSHASARGSQNTLKKLKQEHYHIALETTGSYSLDSLKQVVEDVDLFLMDLKHLDLEKLEQITGANGEEVIENFQYLAKHYPQKVIIRMPVIPRFNADRPTIEAVLDFAAIYGIQEVDLCLFILLAPINGSNSIAYIHIKRSR